MAALEKFEAAEANLAKLERLWSEVESLTPGGFTFGTNPEYEDRCRSYSLLLAALPKIDGWKPSAEPQDLDSIAQSRFDAHEIDEPSAHVSVESWVEEPGRELREYRFRLNNKRRALIREALVSLIDAVDADLRTLRQKANAFEPPHQLDAALWTDFKLHVKQIEVLLGSSVQKPARWSDMHRHMHFGHIGDLDDIERIDWPQVKDGLRKGLYGTHEALPVGVDDLAELVAAKPRGTIATELAWSKLGDDDFERLVFSLISDAPGYENPEWLMQTRAPDRGRDLSVWRVIKDELAGTFRQRVVLQCKHWLSRSVAVPDAAGAKDQMALWSDPRVDVLVIATSGRFTADAVTWIEKHNASGALPRIEMWPESHLERLLAARPALIAEFSLR
jgi:hypothetical protein